MKFSPEPFYTILHKLLFPLTKEKTVINNYYINLHFVYFQDDETDFAGLSAEDSSLECLFLHKLAITISTKFIYIIIIHSYLK